MHVYLYIGVNAMPFVFMLRCIDSFSVENYKYTFSLHVCDVLFDVMQYGRDHEMFVA